MNKTIMNTKAKVNNLCIATLNGLKAVKNMMSE